MNRRGWINIVLFLLCAAAQVDAEPRVLTLNEALALALDRSPDVAEAQSRLDEAEARWRATRAGAFPSLKARGTYDYWTEDQRLFPATKNGEAGVFGPHILGAELVASLPPLHRRSRVQRNGCGGLEPPSRRGSTDPRQRVAGFPCHRPVLRPAGAG